MNWIQRTKELWPGLNSVEAQVILLNCTEHPMTTKEATEAAIKKAYGASGGDLWIAVNQAEQRRN